MVQGKYIDPMTDYGFKRIFGSEVNKDLLIAFLNGLFHGRKQIVDLVYNRNEHVGGNVENGDVIFDLTCTSGNGEEFVIEVQRTAQENLKRRMLYYGSKLIADQAPRGDRRGWNYGIGEVYVIVLLDGFRLPGGGEGRRYLHDVCFMDRETGVVFYDRFGFIYIELINFVKAESELESDLDRWLYVLRHMSGLDRLPLYLRKPVFEKLFQIAEYSKLNKEERTMYDRSLRNKWDAQSIRETAENTLKRGIEKALAEGREMGEKIGIEKGIEKGMEKARLEAEAKLLTEKRSTATRMLERGLAVGLIAEVLSMSIEEIERLREE